MVLLSLRGLVMNHKMAYNGNKNSETYLKNKVYATTTTGAGINLIVQNKRHLNLGGNITSLMIISRGSGYKVGDIVTVLNEDGNLPPLTDRATFPAYTCKYTLEILFNCEYELDFIRFICLGLLESDFSHFKRFVF